MGINNCIINERNFTMKDMSMVLVSFDIISLLSKVLKKFHSIDSEPTKIPLEPNVNLSMHTSEFVSQKRYARIIGSLIFIRNDTQLDLACSVNKLSQFTINPNNKH